MRLKEYERDACVVGLCVLESDVHETMCIEVMHIEKNESNFRF